MAPSGLERLERLCAAETAALSRNQILQQAGTSILAQANQQPQQVLSLLQGG